MGWILPDAPGHEGYVVGLVRDNKHGHIYIRHHRYRELGGAQDIRRADAAARRQIDLGHVQVGCECGWRSPVLMAPIGTHWWPSIVEFPDDDDEWRDAAAELWQRHAEEFKDVSDVEGYLFARRRALHSTARAIARQPGELARCRSCVPGQPCELNGGGK